MRLLAFKDFESLKAAHRQRVEDALRQSNGRDTRWTESIAVGDKGYIEKTKKLLGKKASGWSIVESETGFELRESLIPYEINHDLCEHDNQIYWDIGTDEK